MISKSLASLVGLSLGLVVFLAPLKPVGAEEKTVTLSYDDSSRATKFILPGFVLRTLGRVEGMPGSWYTTVAGQKVDLKFGKRGRICFVGADADGDGEVSRREISPIIGGSARLKVKIESRTLAFAIANAAIYTRSGKISTVRAQVQPAFVRKGKLGSVPIALVDENLDGKFTQDGADAIRIGTSDIAQPLGKVHRIGQAHYRLKASSDGNSLSFEPVTDGELGLVRFGLNTRSLKGLVLTSEDGKVYDLVTSAKSGILPGRYRLRFGLLVSGKNMVPIWPKKNSPVYEVKAGKLNTLRLGAPVRMQFGTAYSGGKVTVGGPIEAIGAGGEEYVISLGYGDGVPAPTIGFYDGRRKLADGRMGYG